MKHLILYISICLMGLGLQAQQQFHVTTSGKPSGTGTLQNPWDLQTALSQKPDVVNGDDTIWLHEGIYTGRFVSSIQSTKSNKYITVAPYKDGQVILNGNVKSNREGVLNVKGGQVIFRDFEITWLGDFSRDKKDKDFQVCAGISHTSGEDCRFYNLTIHNNPGLGIGSWKSTGGTIIENCLIYHNGFIFENGKGGGEGMYVQNMSSDKTRLIKNNIIFGNYYKGIEVWSAGKRVDYEYVKNITLEGNIIFNSGGPSGHIKDNIIVATDDRNGINIAKNIKVLNNVLYHNTDYMANEVNGDAASLTLGFRDSAPVENILVSGNIILGRNNSFRPSNVKSMTFTDNIVYGGYVHYNGPDLQNAKEWKLNNNTYFTKKSGAYRVSGDKDYNLKEWQDKFKLDSDSDWKHIKDFNLKPVLNVTKHTHRPNTYNVSLFNKQGGEVEVDFSDYAANGSAYKIYDVENRNEVLASGIVNTSGTIVFPTNSTKFEAPSHNTLAQKSMSNFGVFIVEFEDTKTTSIEEMSVFQKILKRLGF